MRIQHGGYLSYLVLIIGVLLLGMSIGTVPTAHAIPTTYNTTGFVTGTFTADFQSSVNSYTSWNLSVPSYNLTFKTGPTL